MPNERILNYSDCSLISEALRRMGTANAQAEDLSVLFARLAFKAFDYKNSVRVCDDSPGHVKATTPGGT